MFIIFTINKVRSYLKKINYSLNFYILYDYIWKRLKDMKLNIWFSITADLRVFPLKPKKRILIKLLMCRLSRTNSLHQCNYNGNEIYNESNVIS